MGTPTDTTDNVKVQNQAENCMETSTDPTDDVQVQNQAENHMETSSDLQMMYKPKIKLQSV